MSVPILATIVGVGVLVGGAVGFMLVFEAQESWGADGPFCGPDPARPGADESADGCIPLSEACLQPLEPYPGETPAVFRFTVQNEGEATGARFCLYDAHGVKRFDRFGTLPARAAGYVDAEVPAGEYTGVVRVEGQSPGTHVIVASSPHDIGACTEQAASMESRIRVEDGAPRFGTVEGTKCISHPGDVTPQSQGPVVLDDRVGPLALMLGGVGAASATVFLFLRGERARWLLLGLFTRVVPKRALENEVRARLMGSIEAEPGVRTEELRRTLALGAGQVTFHLRILDRSGLLERVRIGGSDHFFPAGRYGRNDKRRIALLRQANARRFYEALERAGEADVSAVAAASGLSPAYASRLARRFEAAGLVERARRGRRVILRPSGGERA